MNRSAAWVLPLALAACSGLAPTQEAIDVPVISKVQDNIAYQVGLYMVASQGEKTIYVNGVPTAISEFHGKAPDGGSLFACGDGEVSFDITSIKADLTTTDTQTYDASVGATIPIHVVTLNPKFEASKGTDNTQELKYTVWPLDPDLQPAGRPDVTKVQNEVATAPIAQALLDLRTALISSATRFDYSQNPPALRPWKPCFRDFDISKLKTGGGNAASSAADDAAAKAGDAAGNTYQIGLKVTNITKAGLNVGIAGMVSVGANGTWQSATGNILTVSFGQTGLSKLAALIAQQKKDCKTNTKGKRCIDSTKTVGSIAAHIGVLKADVGPVWK